jgi:hypothetical protein
VRLFGPNLAVAGILLALVKRILERMNGDGGGRRVWGLGCVDA